MDTITFRPDQRFATVMAVAAASPPVCIALMLLFIGFGGWLLFAIMGLGPLLYWWSYQRAKHRRLILDDIGIYTTSLVGRWAIRWSEIERWQYRTITTSRNGATRTTHRFEIHGRDGTKGVISNTPLYGIDDPRKFAALLELRSGVTGS